ncbi:MAG TPA: TonB-dependent receptor plug domain-containing protein [Gemmatimonadaceae bacterium]|nr:TonB-dependent receptor plug domain-containing protein [Gemmatimonadaceae bacterium]
MSRLAIALLALSVAACSTKHLARPAVVPTKDERVALGHQRDVLYVLDGRVLPRGDSASVPSAVRDLDPSTIERIEVLKGASAKRAYGDAGASGVVIITTKSNRRGGA